MLGIIGAMKEEVEQLKKSMEGEEVICVAGMEFHRGTLSGRDVTVVQSGIGKVNAAVCAQILVDRFAVNAIINTGIAGSLDASIDIGDIVLSEKTMQHDMDATGFGYDYGCIPQMETSCFVADRQMLETAKSCMEALNAGVKIHTGLVVSGDQFVSEKEKKDWIKKQFDGLCTEMEGAAIAQVAHLNQIPYLVVRAISDKADDSAQMDYGSFEKMAIENSVNLMLAMVKEL